MATELSSNNLVFIGFMGCGKSTIGRKLAHESDNLYFLDTDDLIETYENRKISDIFSQNSEEYFREAEKSTYNWISKNVKHAIISTGGGLPIYIDDISHLGTVIYLKLDFETIQSRLTAQDLQKRPLFQDIKKAKELYTKRENIYMDRASIVIDANKSVDEIVKTIKSMDCYKKFIL
jgi:shikimate kinase